MPEVTLYYSAQPHKAISVPYFVTLSKKDNPMTLDMTNNTDSLTDSLTF
jgi:hypothetical protein